MSYPSIRIEGAIFSPDILERLEDTPGQRPTDFNLDPGAKVKDEIARAWADAQDYWRIFQRKLDSLKPDSPATTETRQQWIVPLLGLLGYQLEYQAKGVELNGKNYTISHRAINRGHTPVHVVGYRELAGLDRKPDRTHIGAARMSAHGLVQEYLNLHDELYGLVTNGRLLRLLRDSSRLIKLTYLEFDLDRIFNDGLFADFAILYRLLHVTRLPISNEAAAESLIERYHQDSLDSGARIRDGLSKAVEQAIRDFANGFLSQRDNEALRQRIRDGELTPEIYYQHLLRLIYRLLFLLVIEERDLVFPPSALRQQRDIFRNYYSVERLRLLSEKRHLADKRFHDHWLSLLATFKLFEAHGPGEKLGIAPLAGDLFGPDAIGPLAQCRLGNDVLLGCLRSLGLYQHPDNGQTIRVNYAALNVEEFGSVYEGLLEFQPVFNLVGERIEFDFAQGDERAATGSHYTPDDLVQPLIKHSLDYLIADALKKSEPSKALLDLRIADISCGSGHILLAAARRIATELAIVRTGEEQPSPTAFRAAIRDVIRECIYGVDLNPLAVELCKVALWLEAHTPGEPLNFLDHHIKCGNAIVGFARREEAERGVPDEAFKTLPDDDKDTASLLRKRNKKEREDHAAGQLPLSPAMQKQLDDILRGWNELNRLPEHTPDEIEAKKARYLAFTQSKDSWLLHQIASIPIAQFYIQKRPDNLQMFVTDSTYRRYWKGEISPQGQATAEAWAMAERKRFFHWFLEFPEIMERGGFDCILGNPPYLGNRAISGKYGDAFLGYVKWGFSPAAAVDLVTYFVRRIFDLLNVGGSMALISTNTIAQGAAREGGLDVIVNSGGSINFAIRAKQWTGRAAVSVSLIAIHNREWKGECTLDGKHVAHITPYLDTADSLGDPITLSENADKSFQGSIVLGLGFVLTNESAANLISRDSSTTDVIFPYLNGEDLNSHPQQRASRFVINFFDWDEDRCRNNYPEPYSIVEEKVKPERTRTDESGNFVLRKPLPQKWWIYADKRPKLYESIRNFDKVIVGARVSKYVNFVFVPSRQVFMDKLVVIAEARSKTKCNIFWRKCCMERNYKQLSLEERALIQTQLSLGFKPSQIAQELGRSAGTLSRELKRNGWVRPKLPRGVGRPLVAGGYRADVAHRRATACTTKPRIPKKLRPDTALWDQVMSYLQEGYSPEQIAGTLATVHPDAPSLQVSHETIYTAIYAMPRGDLRTEVIGWLRFGHAKRRPRARGEDRRGRIPDMVSIHDRPPEIDERLIPGHWEGDLIKGAHNRSSVGTLVERTTLFTVLAKMEDGSAASAVKGFAHVLNRIDAQKRLSMTYDQGKEMAGHPQLTLETGIKVYFADPHSPWQRGINENTNGLARQYLPKGSDLSVFSQEELDAIAWKLNTRPRKSLGFKCPAELFTPDAFDFRQHHAALFALGA